MDNDFNSSRAAIRQKFRQVQVEVARKEDFGVNDKTFIVNTHLGEFLNFNDTVLAYDLEQCCISDLDEHALKDDRLPDLVIVKKTYPKYRKKQRSRYWKLKHFDDLKQGQKKDQDMEQSDEEIADDSEEDQQAAKQKKNKQVPKSKRGAKRKARLAAAADARHGKDYQLFLQDLEEDKELRDQVNLYRDDDIMAELEARVAGMTLDDKA